MTDNSRYSFSVKWKQFAYVILFSYLTVWLYTLLSQFWAVQGGSSTTLNYFEFPLIILFCTIIFFTPHSNKIISKYTFAPPLTILGIYILYDALFSLFARSPRLSDCQNILSLYSVSPLLFFTFFSIILFISMPTLLSFAIWYSHSTPRKRALTIVLKVSAFTCLLLLATSEYSYQYQKSNLRFFEWSNVGSIKKSGRITCFLYYYNKRQETLASLDSYEHFSIFNQFYQKSPAHKRNIHIIVLESFADPRQILDVTYTPSPLHDGLRTYLTDNEQFSLVTTPVYGGGTAQTEFEILTGIPALAQINSIEFNLFEGTASSSLIQMLHQTGYYTMASIATEPVYYNSKLAYKGMGFDEINFLGENAYFEDKNDRHLFDGDLLSANGTYIRSYLSQEKETKPLLNYIVGMFGHLPFTRNKTVRPDVITTHPDTKLVVDMANQFYYRTRALAQYLQTLREIDPQSIIFITSDHLPPIFNQNDIIYKHSNKSNIAILLNNFDTIDISEKTTYETSHIIWNLLINSSDPTNTDSLFSEKSKEDFYFSFILEAMGLEEIIASDMKK